MEGLERTAQRLEEYAVERGLTVRPELVWPGQPLPAEQPGPIKFAAWSIAGVLPGGVGGRLRHQAVYGQTFGMNVAMQHTIMVCRIPESVGYLPMLAVRTDGLEPTLFYWAGDRRPREDVGGFESTELDRRYIVEVAKGQDQAWLRQLFPPTFIDWLASSTPVDFGFRLDGGVFTCECPQYRGQHRADGEVDFEHLDLLAGAGGRAASRIRDEVLEESQVSWGGTAPDSAAAHEARTKGSKVGRFLGAVIRLAGGGSVDDSVTLFGKQHGLEPKATAEFHASHINLPLPGAASDVLTGPLPGSDRACDLAWLEFSSTVDVERKYVAVVVEAGRRLPSLWVDSDDVTVPGFGVDIAPAALERARAAGYGISAAGTEACIYLPTPPMSFEWPSAVAVESLCRDAPEIVDAL